MQCMSFFSVKLQNYRNLIILKLTMHTVIYALQNSFILEIATPSHNFLYYIWYTKVLKRQTISIELSTIALISYMKRIYGASISCYIKTNLGVRWKLVRFNRSINFIVVCMCVRVVVVAVVVPTRIRAQNIILIISNYNAYSDVQTLYNVLLFNFNGLLLYRKRDKEMERMS